MSAVVRRAFWAVREREDRLLGALHGSRRRWFETQVRAAAAWNRAEVELRIDPSVRFGRDVRATVQPGTSSVLHIGAGTTVGDRVLFKLKGGQARIGDGCDLRGDVTIGVAGDLELAGDNVLSWGTVVHCDELVRLGPMTSAAEFVTVADSTHFHTAPGVPFHHNLHTAPVRIGANVWLCPKATVAHGVTIGDDCVVAANAVVTGDVPAGQVVAGAPAKVVRPSRAAAPTSAP